ncbi:MAG: NGG1p interacting factor NIF3 [Actinomycetes bacterium]|jgi:putative NIF3 family GTP cyclohydrolase 1 type 2|nr:NGG1p interacting factor NIF3 [Actinomycetes bacterium]
MKLRELYQSAIDQGIAADPRPRAEIDAALAREQAAYDKLTGVDREVYDTERLSNPYADTRINVGDPDTEIKGLIVGIDMEVGEVMLTQHLRDAGEPIDLILTHHPSGPGLANIDLVMPVQADMWIATGVSASIADTLIGPHAAKTRRDFAPYNHYRPIDACRLLGIPLMSCHTPADNSVQQFVQAHIDAAAPRTLDDLRLALLDIPEYLDAAKKGYGPLAFQGEPSVRCGKIVVEMTGGVEGPTAALERMAAAGVGTVVGMHYGEEHRKKAEELGINLMVAGHMSSDTIGMNLVLDAVERAHGPLQVTCASGTIRVKR